MFNKEIKSINQHFCNAEAMFRFEKIICGLIADYKIGKKDKIFRCNLHCPEEYKRPEYLINNKTF